MKRSMDNQRPLLAPWLAWQELPEATRREALDLLTSLYLEIVNLSPGEPEIDDAFDH